MKMDITFNAWRAEMMAKGELTTARVDAMATEIRKILARLTSATATIMLEGAGKLPTLTPALDEALYGLAALHFLDMPAFTLALYIIHTERPQ